MSDEKTSKVYNRTPEAEMVCGGSTEEETGVSEFSESTQTVVHPDYHLTVEGIDRAAESIEAFAAQAPAAVKAKHCPCCSCECGGCKDERDREWRARLAAVSRPDRDPTK